MAISFEGRTLTQEEEYQIIETITENTSISIICIVDNDETHADLVKQQIEPITIRYPAEKANFTAEHFVPDRCWRAYPVS